MRRINLLVVDDQPDILDLYSEILKAQGYEVRIATSAEQARSAIASQFFDLLLLDERMPRMSGTQFLTECRHLYPGIGAIFITGHADLNFAIRAFRAGAIDLLQKPVTKEELVTAAERALTKSQIIREQRYSRHISDHYATFDEIIGDSEPLRQVLKQIRQVMPTNVPVLLQGESGTGKELLAHALHCEGPRKHNPFVPVNFAAVPETLLEAMLFGHKKGAFTDATEDRKGTFETANGGTIFLDEIGEMTAEAQVRLLRVLQEKTIVRLGETREIKVDVRIVAATNRDLAVEVEAKRFRLDLYHRLNVMPITVPPLRVRKDDIPALAAYFLGRHQAEIGKPIKAIAPEAIDKLCRYHWPGNIRELQNVIQRAIILAESDTITPQDILLEANRGSREDKTSSMDLLQLQLPFRKAQQNFEQQYFTALLERAQGNKTKAAELAELDRTVLYQHLRKIQEE